MSADVKLKFATNTAAINSAGPAADAQQAGALSKGAGIADTAVTIGMTLLDIGLSVVGGNAVTSAAKAAKSVKDAVAVGKTVTDIAKLTEKANKAADSAVKIAKTVKSVKDVATVATEVASVGSSGVNMAASAKEHNAAGIASAAAKGLTSTNTGLKTIPAIKSDFPASNSAHVTSEAAVSAPARQA